MKKNRIAAAIIAVGSAASGTTKINYIVVGYGQK